MAGTSGNVAATIVVPTHSHGVTLYGSVVSALQQTVPVEVFIIGDGADEETRTAALELERCYARVRFFDRSKSSSRGEKHRHEALGEARGRIVCYLSDDDLYLPHHVEGMLGLLENSDFAHALAIEAQPDGGVASWTVDLGILAFQSEVLSGQNRVPLSAAGHTLVAYRRLAEGWKEAPAGTPSDLFMWQKFVRHPGCRFQAGSRPSVLVFPSPKRKQRSNRERLEEMQRWIAEVAGESGLARLTQRVFAVKAREMAVLQARMLNGNNAGKPAAPPPQVQVFFPNEKGHNEHESAWFSVRSGAWERIETRFCCVPQTPVRVDPGIRPGSIEIESIALRSGSGKILWELTAENAGELSVEGTAVLIEAGKPFVMVSDGEDPQLILPRLACADGEVVLEFTIRLDDDPSRMAALLAGRLRALQSNRVPLRRASHRFFRRS